MESVVEFFKNLSPFQMFLIGGGVILLWPFLQTTFKSLFLNDKKDDTNLDLDDGCNHDLTNLVYKWECLNSCCHKNGLHDACEQLLDVFPMLVKPYVPEEDDKPDEPETTDN